MNRDTLTNLVKSFLGQLVFMVQPHAVPVNVASEKGYTTDSFMGQSSRMSSVDRRARVVNGVSESL